MDSPIDRVSPRYTEKQTWYFTFGQAHFFAKRYMVIKNATFDEARTQMVRWFGTQWAFQYEESDWNHSHGEEVSQAERYNLTELEP